MMNRIPCVKLWGMERKPTFLSATLKAVIHHYSKVKQKKSLWVLNQLTLASTINKNN